MEFVSSLGTVPVRGWHADEVEGVDTAALSGGNIVVPFEATAKEVWGVVTHGVQLSHVSGSSKVSSHVHAEFDACALNVKSEPVLSNVEFVWLTIDGDIHGWECVSVSEASGQDKRFEHFNNYRFSLRNTLKQLDCQSNQYF